VGGKKLLARRNVSHWDVHTVFDQWRFFIDEEAERLTAKKVEGWLRYHTVKDVLKAIRIVARYGVDWKTYAKPFTHHDQNKFYLTQAFKRVNSILYHSASDVRFRPNSAVLGLHSMD
jgi:hypothetical protein